MQPLSYWFELAWGHGAGGHMNTYACRFHIKPMFHRGHAIGGETIALPFRGRGCVSTWVDGGTSSV